MLLLATDSAYFPGAQDSEVSLKKSAFKEKSGKKLIWRSESIVSFWMNRRYQTGCIEE